MMVNIDGSDSSLGHCRSARWNTDRLPGSTG
jgi:hypothetical protein